MLSFGEYFLWYQKYVFCTNERCNSSSFMHKTFIEIYFIFADLYRASNNYIIHIYLYILLPQEPNFIIYFSYGYVGAFISYQEGIFMNKLNC